MADRTPIFSTKVGTQIGYVENGGAFDLSGRRRCNYNAATGNLSDPVTEKIVGYVSWDGNFVVPSRIAAELFEQPGDSEASTPSLTAEGEKAKEYATKSAEGEHDEHATKSAEGEHDEHATKSAEGEHDEHVTKSAGGEHDEHVPKSAEGEHAEEHVPKSAEGEHAEEDVPKSNRPPALDESADAFLERVREMMENFKKEAS
jgi:hypothetical protein